VSFAVLTALCCAGLGYLLGRLSLRAQEGTPEIERRIGALLPGIDCGLCGHPGCAPYAKAIAQDAAPITLCPPGGAQLVASLGSLLNVDPPARGPAPGAPAYSQIAVIGEDACIGCGLCIPACPFAAISGAPQAMHTVLERYCTGCELCVAPCPVDCISMAPIPHGKVIASATADG